LLAIRTPTAFQKENGPKPKKSANEVNAEAKNVCHKLNACVLTPTCASAREVDALECGGLPPLFLQLGAEPPNGLAVKKKSRRLVPKSKKLAGEPVSRILCRTQTAERPAYAAIIPLVPVSLPGSSSLPEGFHPRWLAPPRKEHVHSHERRLSEPGRLSPPIWPCTTRGFPCPQCHHRSGGLLPHLFTLAKRCVHVEAGL